MPCDPSAMPAPAAALSVEHCNCVSLRRASRRISLFYDACLAPSGLRATQFAMMSALERSGDLSVQALALLLDMDRSTAGQNVKLLERDGVIEIGRSARDGRARVIRLTMTGVERLAAARPLWQQAQSGIETVNGPAITAQMRAMLKDLALPA